MVKINRVLNRLRVLFYFFPVTGLNFTAAVPVWACAAPNPPKAMPVGATAAVVLPNPVLAPNELVAGWEKSPPPPDWDTVVEPKRPPPDCVVWPNPPPAEYFHKCFVSQIKKIDARSENLRVAWNGNKVIIPKTRVPTLFERSTQKYLLCFCINFSLKVRYFCLVFQLWLLFREKLFYLSNSF